MKKLADKKIIHLGMMVFLLLIWSLLIITNYKAGTYLSGWDNLHPEFYLSMNIERSLSTVWQEYQGLGLLGGMGHGADLVRQLIMIPFVAVLPNHLIRYSFVFFSLLIGSYGVFYLVRNLLSNLHLNQQYTKSSPAHFTTEIAAFLAAVYYLLNLGTVQNFYVPFEPFYWFYGSIPWIFLSLIVCLQTKKIIHFYLLSLVLLLASPLAYLQTNFLALSMVIAVFLLGWILSKSHHIVHFFSTVKTSLVIGLILVLCNAFWLFPVMYFTITNSDVTVNSLINQIDTPETSLMNHGYGSLYHLVFPQGYWLSLHDFDTEFGFQYLFQPWLIHLSNPSVQAIYFVFFAIIIAGIGFALQKRHTWGMSFLLILLLCWVMLLGQNPPFGFAVTFLYDLIPLLSQVFRSPFTKWVVPTSFVYSVLFGFGSYWIFDKVHSKISQKIVLPCTIVIFAGLVFISLPSFSGHFIYQKMRVTQPSEYRKLFDFFSNEPKERRIAFLPVDSIWGWNFYDWGYRGSGFPWYGIEQPILDRAFDVWSQYDETFYHQFSTALYKKEPKLIKEILTKYDVAYILIDEHVFDPNSKTDAFLFTDSILFLEDLGAEKVWSEGKITVYNVQHITQAYQFITAPPKYTFVNTENTYSRFDPVYHRFGEYLSSVTDTAEYSNEIYTTYYYPLADIFKQTIDDVFYTVRDLETEISFSKKTLSDAQFAHIVIPPLSADTPYTFHANIEKKKDAITIVFDPLFHINLGSQNIAVHQLQSITLPLEKEISQPIIVLNKQAVSLEDESYQGFFVLLAGKPLSIQVFDPEDVITNENQEFQVEHENIVNHIEGDSFWKSHLREKKTSITKPIQTLKIVTQAPSSQLIDPNQEKEWIRNCDVLQRGNFSYTSQNNQIRYQADNRAAVCDFFYFPNLSPRLDYLFSVKGGNISGLSSKTYIFNQENMKTDILTFLPDKPSFRVNFTLPSWKHYYNNGYSASFESRSYGGEKVENYLSEINIYPVPLELLSQIYFSNPESAIQTNNVSIHPDYKKTGTYKYQFKATVSKKQGVIGLSQGFDKEWIATAKRVNQSVPQSEKIQLPHFLFSGWANAWLVPEGEWQVTVLYWPQYLAFIGFGLLGITMLLLGGASVFSLINDNQTQSISRHHRSKEKFPSKLSTKKFTTQPEVQRRKKLHPKIKQKTSSGLTGEWKSNFP